MSGIGIGDLLNSDHLSVQESSTDFQTDATVQDPNVNYYLAKPEKGLELCAQLIAQSNHSSKEQTLLKQIVNCIEDEFLSFSKNSSNPVAVETYANLQKISRTLSEIVSFPHLEKYNTVAVGGSFSAGKSRFLNTVLGYDSLLPTDTTPTTSIPTYITKGDDDNIQALNFYHHKAKIDEQALQAICHEFDKQFKVSFSHILQLISVERQSAMYENIAFLDTPGYSKADNIFDADQNTDERLAKEHLKRADYLIWLVDQQNGTIPQQDIEFLESIGLNRPVLVIISKADKKPKSQINEIIETTRNALIEAEINFVDVIGYSAANGVEFSETGNVLSTLLTDINQPREGTVLLWSLKNVLKKYDDYLLSTSQRLLLTNKTIKEIEFDESVIDETVSHFQDLKSQFKQQYNQLQQHQKQYQEIQLKLTNLISELCCLLGLDVSRTPKAIEIKQYQSQQNSTTESLSFSVDALVEGDTNHIADLSEWHNISGTISRFNAVGMCIDINKKIEILVPKMRLKPYLNTREMTDAFHIGQAVTVHLLDRKKATVQLEISQ